MNPYLQIALVIVVFGIITFLGIEYGKKEPKVINYEQKYDSLQKQLEFSRSTRIDLSHTIDSLIVANDSLGNLSKQIEYKIVRIPGTYNKYNSQELTNKMIEGYEQREQ